MTREEAFYVVGNIPVPIDDESYDICKYQEAKAIALDSIEKLQKIESLYGIDKFGEVLTREDRDREVQKVLEGE